MHDAQVVLQFDLQLLSVQVHLFRAEIRTCQSLGLGRASPQQMWISKGEYELLLKLLIRHFPKCAELAERKDAKVEELAPSSGGVFVPDHQHMPSTALVVFSPLSRR